MPLLAEVVSCHEGGVFVPSYISRGTPRAAKGAAASTSSQPQAVMDSSADTSAPLASRLAGSKSLASCLPRDIGFSIGHLSKPSSYRMCLVELSSQRRRPVNEAVPTRATPDTNQSAPGAGAPTGDFWERSGQHEPRRVPGRGAPLIEVVFQKAQARQRSRPSVGSLLLLRRYGDGRRLPPQLPQHIPVRPRH